MTNRRTGGGPGGWDLAVTGAGVLCATAADVDEFAVALRQGRCGIADRPEADGLGSRLAADLPDFEFGAAMAGFPAGLRKAAARVGARAPLPVQASIVVAAQAWTAAGLESAPLPAGRVGLIVAGHNLGDRYADRMRPRFESSSVHLPGSYALRYLDTDHIGVLSQVLGITGEGFTVGGASASGNLALLHAARMIRAGAADACLVVGALTDLSEMQRQAFYNLGAMARTGCRPFDAGHNGFVAGQGAACLVLESAASAARRGAEVAAWLLGAAQRLDGNSLADPSVAGEAGVLAEVLRVAGLQPDQVDYVNAHGTGSPAGDVTELRALGEVFGPTRPWINSTKGLVGHCICAAGLVEAVAVIVQMRHGFLHPNVGLTEPLDATARLVPRHAVPAQIRIALSNGFGFGGFNTSVALAHRDAGEAAR